ncbi:hypothetical protein D3C81_1938610 [compost metagenome]
MITTYRPIEAIKSLESILPSVENYSDLLLGIAKDDLQIVLEPQYTDNLNSIRKIDAAIYSRNNTPDSQLWARLAAFTFNIQDDDDNGQKHSNTNR